MTEQQYSDLHTKLGKMANPWLHHDLYNNPTRVKSKWRYTVKRWRKALDQVLGDD